MTTSDEPDIADAVGGGAKIDVQGFQIRRAVEQGPLGLNAVRLDPAVLAGSRTLSDLRVIDGRCAIHRGPAEPYNYPGRTLDLRCYRSQGVLVTRCHIMRRRRKF